MRGWVIYKDTGELLKPEDFEIKRLVEEAERQSIDLRVLAPEQFDITVTRGDRESVLIDGVPEPLPDFVLPRMGVTTTYFALAVLRHLEHLGVFCCNRSSAIETVKDKLYTQQILVENNLPVPRTMLVKFPVDVSLVEKQLGFPVVVKTLSGTQGSGVYLSKSKSGFGDLMQLIESTNKKANIILQEFIESSHGRDLRVFTIGGRAIACMERRAKDDSFKANYTQGGNVSIHEITPEIEWLATQTSQVLNLDIAGIDLLFAGDHFAVCEANSAPGFEALEPACDIDIPKAIYHYIRIRLGMFDS